MTHLDGNGAAGVLREVFAAEMTDSSCTCAGCGKSSAVGGLLLYGSAMGTVLRCPTCGAVVLRVTGTRRRWTLEIRGLVQIARGAP
jgi:ribosomal protein S27E